MTRTRTGPAVGGSSTRRERDRHDARDRVGDPGERRRGQVEVPGRALRALVGDRDPDGALRPGDVQDRAAGGGAAEVGRRQGHVRARGRGVRVPAVGQPGERVEGRRPGPGRAGRRAGRRAAGRSVPAAGGGGRRRRRAVRGAARSVPAATGAGCARPGPAPGGGAVGGAGRGGVTEAGRSSDCRRGRAAARSRRRPARTAPTRRRGQAAGQQHDRPPPGRPVSRRLHHARHSTRAGPHRPRAHRPAAPPTPSAAAPRPRPQAGRRPARRPAARTGPRRRAPARTPR